MGVTGSGKSTFISLLANEPVKIGHNLTSCKSTLMAKCQSQLIRPGTSTVQGYTCTIDGRNVLLLDTPGFDDTERSDIEILGEIAMFLSSLHFSPVDLIGVIYLQRITDARMSGSSMKSIEICEKLCGLQACPNIVFVTTMWGKLGEHGEEEGAAREMELKTNSKFFGTMMQHNARMERHSGTKESAQMILSNMIKVNQPIVLDIQEQMGEQGLPLDQTPVGQIVYQGLIDQQKRYEAELKELEQQLEEANQADDKSMITILSQDRQRQRELIKKVEKDRAKLCVTLEQLAERRSPQFGALVRESRRMAQDDGELRALREMARIGAADLKAAVAMGEDIAMRKVKIEQGRREIWNQERELSMSVERRRKLEDRERQRKLRKKRYQTSMWTTLSDFFSL